MGSLEVAEKVTQEVVRVTNGVTFPPLESLSVNGEPEMIQLVQINRS